MVAWSLVFHIAGLVMWVGSLLVVTQILGVQVTEHSPEVSAVLSRLESKLLKGLAHPGAALTVITGFIMAYHNPDYLQQSWLHAKLLLVVILVAVDLRLTFQVKAYHEGRVELNRRDCLLFHGAISLLFLAILVLAVIKPFSPHPQHVQLGEIGAAVRRQ
jgi:putative membrane protein